MLSGRTAAQTAMGGVSEVVAVKKAESANPWNGAADGTYKATVDGMHDRVEVAFTVSKGMLTGIEITSGRESMLITDEQLAAYTGDIIGKQSAYVDVVTGATTDSQLIVNALASAFAK